MDIQDSPTGKIVTSPKGYRAFVPNNLPPKLEWNNAVVHALSRADFILGKLAREGNKLPNPHLLIRPFVTREAVLSSKIEGTLTSISEFLADEVGAYVDRSPDDVQEVKNYIVALEYGLKRIKELPLSLRLIREVHRELMQ